MSSSVAEKVDPRHRLLPKKADQPAKADLRIPTMDDFQAQIGACLDAARLACGWTVDELAGHLPPPKKGGDTRGEKQVRAWIKGEERMQLDAVFAVEELRAPFVIALAKLAAKDDSGVVIRTTVELRQKVG